MRACRIVVGLVALACIDASIVQASAGTKSFAISAFGSYQTYGMSDVNRAMQDALASYAGSQAEKREINGDFGFGAGMRIWTSETIFISLDLQRLLASNSGSGQYAGSTYTVDLDVPATGITMSLGYVLAPKSRIRYGIAGGGGFYLTTGELAISGPGVNDRTDLEGSGFGAHGLGLVLARLTRTVGVEVSAGYRYAKTTDITADGSRIRNPDGSLSRIDWSGFMSRAGLTVWLSGR